MTDEQYENIKEKVLNLFSNVKSFKWDANEFYNKFELEHPYFKELQQRLSQDNNPFYVKAIGYFGASDNDPVEDILFYKK